MDRGLLLDHVLSIGILELQQLNALLNLGSKDIFCYKWKLCMTMFEGDKG